MDLKEKVLEVFHRIDLPQDGDLWWAPVDIKEDSAPWT
jgi:hypothetical protein